MTATPASLVAPSADLLEAVRARYGLASIAVSGRLAGGHANDLYRLDTERGPLVLRLAHPPSPAGIEWEHALVQLLAARVPEVVPPVPARDGTTWFPHGLLGVWLLPYVDGTPADRGDEWHRLEAARLLARVHRAAAELELEPRPDVASGPIHGDFFRGNVLVSAGRSVALIRAPTDRVVDWEYQLHNLRSFANLA